jgi:hypothetical protein
MVAAQLRDEQHREAPPPQPQGGGAPAAGGGAAGFWPDPQPERQQAGQDEPVFVNFGQGEQPQVVIPGLNGAPGDAAMRARQAETDRLANGGPPNVQGPQPSGNHYYIVITTCVAAKILQ